jgi:hypothetical protein
MYLYIELWSAKEVWIKLTTEQRKAKIDQLLQEAKLHPITGVVPFSFKKAGDVYLFDGVTEQPVIISDAVARPTGYRYAAAWMVPSLELIHQFEKRVENLGWWFEYFDQKNAWGVMDVAATVGDMIGTTQSAPPPAEPPQSAEAGRLGRMEYSVRQIQKDVADLMRGLHS